MSVMAHFDAEAMMFYLGIDVSKAKLDCALLDGGSGTGKVKTKVVPNNAAGFQQLLEWMHKQKVPVAHVVLEPTGVYHEAAALALTTAGLPLSMINPARVREFARATGIKTKTDKADSIVLARYGATPHEEELRLWQPPPVSVRRLTSLLARRDALAGDLQRELNRQEKLLLTETPEPVLQSVASSISFLKAEVKRLQTTIDEHIDNDPDMNDKRKLLETIPGVGPAVSMHMVCLLVGKMFDSAEQLAAYLGLIPVQWDSGTSVHRRPRMSKAGPSHLRKLLYLPAVVATRHNPHVKDLYERLLLRGKPKMAAIGAAMRKLAHLCFGVVHSGKPYSKNFAPRA